MGKLLNAIKATLQGVPLDAYDDEPVGNNFWQSPGGEKYRPKGSDYRIVKQSGFLLLEIKSGEGWTEAQWYNPGRDSDGRLHKARWEAPPGRYSSDHFDSLRKIGNGLTGKSIPPKRELLLSSGAA